MKTTDEIRAAKYRAEMRSHAMEWRLSIAECHIWANPEAAKEHIAFYLQNAKDYRDMAAQALAPVPYPTMSPW